MRTSRFKFRFISKYGLVLIVLVFFSTCIEPYYPKLDEYKSLLVVEGMITNANSSNTIRLSRTFQSETSGKTGINGANVFISDDKGNINPLMNFGDGIYKTDSLLFRGYVGRTYMLHIIIEDVEYESAPYLMQPVSEIDSVYIKKDQKLINNDTETRDGITIYLDSKDAGIGQYYRWTYDETWKFKVPSPKVFDYIQTAIPNHPNFNQITDPKEFCWKFSKSNEVIIRSFTEGQAGKIEKQPLCFISTGENDRLLMKYSILVKQFSISKEEYDFWNGLNKVNEAGSDIFARQPFSVNSNIRCKTKPEEKVLGFFQVSAVAEKRKNISYDDVAPLGLPFYSYPCRTWQFTPDDFDPHCPYCIPKTWDDVYWYLCIASDYTFTRPILSYGKLVYLEFTRPECGNCELSGTHTEPDFWHDLKW